MTSKHLLDSRRKFLLSAGCGFGYLALADLAHQARAAAVGESATHHAPRAKRVIFLFMHGGPSQVDLFDYKPRLQQEDGKDLPLKLPPNIDAKPKLMKSPWKFARHGESGLWMSEILPNLARHADDLCVIRSMHSKGQSHGQAVSMLHTGSDSLIRPSVGAWVGYGLSTENQDLPSFVSVCPTAQHGGPRNYGSAFLPARYQATAIQLQGSRVPRIAFLDGDAGERGRRRLEMIQAMNHDHQQRAGRDEALEGVIASYELAFRMQNAAPQVMDIAQESKATQELYGIGGGPTDRFGRQCLVARRLLEAGVRYVQVSTENVWDQHGDLKGGHEKNCRMTDQPIAALLTDLKHRGLLEDTLVVWGGEFGRTPVVQGSNGRDHCPQGFTMWLAGGGVKGGLAYGETDEYGYYAEVDKVHMHDLHATMLHLLGLDHEQLTYRYAGRDFRLTDVHGRVVRDILA